MRIKGLWKYTILGVIAWFFVDQQHEGLRYLTYVSPMLKHVVKFSFLLFFGIIGYMAWGLYNEPWLRKLWLIVYGVVIAILALVGFLDLFWRFGDGNFRLLLGYFRLFFTSPLPFGILAFLLRMRDRGKKTPSNEEFSSEN